MEQTEENSENGPIPQTDDTSNSHGKSCALCGCSTPAVRCDRCSSQIFCLSCDDMYHRHPKRKLHLRKAVDSIWSTARSPRLRRRTDLPGDPSKIPIPPPRSKKRERHTIGGRLFLKPTHELGSFGHSKVDIRNIPKPSKDVFAGLKTPTSIEGTYENEGDFQIRNVENVTKTEEIYENENVPISQGENVDSSASRSPWNLTRTNISSPIQVSIPSSSPDLIANGQQFGYPTKQSRSIADLSGAPPAGFGHHPYNLPHYPYMHPPVHPPYSHSMAHLNCAQCLSSSWSNLVSPHPSPYFHPMPWGSAQGSLARGHPPPTSNGHMKHSHGDLPSYPDPNFHYPYPGGPYYANGVPAVDPNFIKDLHQHSMDAPTMKKSSGSRPASTEDMETTTDNTADIVTDTDERNADTGSVTHEDPDELPPVPEKPTEPWACVHCTFINPPGDYICQVCCKTSYANKCSNTQKAVRPTDVRSSESPAELVNLDAISQSSDFLKHKAQKAEDSIGEDSLENEDVSEEKHLTPVTPEPSVMLTTETQTSTSVKSTDVQTQNLIFQTVASSTDSIFPKQEISIQTEEEPVVKNCSVATDPMISSQSMESLMSGVSAPPYHNRRAGWGRGASFSTQSLYERGRSRSPLPRSLSHEAHSFGRDSSLPPEEIMHSWSQAWLMSDPMYYKPHNLPGLGQTLVKEDYFDGTWGSMDKLNRRVKNKQGNKGEELQRPRFHRSLDDLKAEKNQDLFHSRELQFLQTVKEAERCGFSLEDLHVAYLHCGKENPVFWLEDNWSSMIKNVIALAAKYGEDNEENDVGVISALEAKEALHIHRGDLWDAVTECIENRQRKILELTVRGNFTQKQIADALKNNNGNVELAYADLLRASSKRHKFILSPGMSEESEDLALYNPVEDSSAEHGVRASPLKAAKLDLLSETKVDKKKSDFLTKLSSIRQAQSERRKAREEKEMIRETITQESQDPLETDLVSPQLDEDKALKIALSSQISDAKPLPEEEIIEADIELDLHLEEGNEKKDKKDSVDDTIPENYETNWVESQGEWIEEYSDEQWEEEGDGQWVSLQKKYEKMEKEFEEEAREMAALWEKEELEDDVFEEESKDLLHQTIDSEAERLKAEQEEKFQQWVKINLEKSLSEPEDADLNEPVTNSDLGVEATALSKSMEFDADLICNSPLQHYPTEYDLSSKLEDPDWIDIEPSLEKQLSEALPEIEEMTDMQRDDEVLMHEFQDKDANAYDPEHSEGEWEKIDYEAELLELEEEEMMNASKISRDFSPEVSLSKLQFEEEERERAEFLKEELLAELEAKTDTLPVMESTIISPDIVGSKVISTTKEKSPDLKIKKRSPGLATKRESSDGSHPKPPVRRKSKLSASAIEEVLSNQPLDDNLPPALPVKKNKSSEIKDIYAVPDKHKSKEDEGSGISLQKSPEISRKLPPEEQGVDLSLPLKPPRLNLSPSPKIDSSESDNKKLLSVTRSKDGSPATSVSNESDSNCFADSESDPEIRTIRQKYMHRKPAKYENEEDDFFEDAITASKQEESNKSISQPVDLHSSTLQSMLREEFDFGPELPTQIGSRGSRVTETEIASPKAFREGTARPLQLFKASPAVSFEAEEKDVCATASEPEKLLQEQRTEIPKPVDQTVTPPVPEPETNLEKSVYLDAQLAPLEMTDTYYYNTAADPNQASQQVLRVSEASTIVSDVQYYNTVVSEPISRVNENQGMKFYQKSAQMLHEEKNISLHQQFIPEEPVQRLELEQSVIQDELDLNEMESASAADYFFGRYNEVTVTKPKKKTPVGKSNKPAAVVGPKMSTSQVSVTPSSVSPQMTVSASPVSFTAVDQPSKSDSPQQLSNINQESIPEPTPVSDSKPPSIPKASQEPVPEESLSFAEDYFFGSYNKVVVPKKVMVKPISVIPKPKSLEKLKAVEKRSLEVVSPEIMPDVQPQPEPEADTEPEQVFSDAIPSTLSAAPSGSLESIDESFYDAYSFNGDEFILASGSQELVETGINTDRKIDSKGKSVHFEEPQPVVVPPPRKNRHKLESNKSSVSSYASAADDYSYHQYGESSRSVELDKKKLQLCSEDFKMNQGCDPSDFPSDSLSTSNELQESGASSEISLYNKNSFNLPESCPKNNSFYDRTTRKSSDDFEFLEIPVSTSRGIASEESGSMPEMGETSPESMLSAQHMSQDDQDFVSLNSGEETSKKHTCPSLPEFAAGDSNETAATILDNKEAAKEFSERENESTFISHEIVKAEPLIYGPFLQSASNESKDDHDDTDSLLIDNDFDDELHLVEETQNLINEFCDSSFLESFEITPSNEMKSLNVQNNQDLSYDSEQEWKMNEERNNSLNANFIENKLYGPDLNANQSIVEEDNSFIIDTSSLDPGPAISDSIPEMLEAALDFADTNKTSVEDESTVENAGTTTASEFSHEKHSEVIKPLSVLCQAAASTFESIALSLQNISIQSEESIPLEQPIEKVKASEMGFSISESLDALPKQFENNLVTNVEIQDTEKVADVPLELSQIQENFQYSMTESLDALNEQSDDSLVTSTHSSISTQIAVSSDMKIQDLDEEISLCEKTTEYTGEEALKIDEAMSTTDAEEGLDVNEGEEYICSSKSESKLQSFEVKEVDGFEQTVSEIISSDSPNELVTERVDEINKYKSFVQSSSLIDSVSLDEYDDLHLNTEEKDEGNDTLEKTTIEPVIETDTLITEKVETFEELNVTLRKSFSETLEIQNNLIPEGSSKVYATKHIDVVENELRKSTSFENYVNPVVDITVNTALIPKETSSENLAYLEKNDEQTLTTENSDISLEENNSEIISESTEICKNDNLEETNEESYGSLMSHFYDEWIENVRTTATYTTLQQDVRHLYATYDYSGSSAEGSGNVSENEEASESKLEKLSSPVILSTKLNENVHGTIEDVLQNEPLVQDSYHTISVDPVVLFTIENEKETLIASITDNLTSVGYEENIKTTELDEPIKQDMTKQTITQISSSETEVSKVVITKEKMDEISFKNQRISSSKSCQTDDSFEEDLFFDSFDDGFTDPTLLYFPVKSINIEPVKIEIGVQCCLVDTEIVAPPTDSTPDDIKVVRDDKLKINLSPVLEEISSEDKFVEPPENILSHADADLIPFKDSTSKDSESTSEDSDSDLFLEPHSSHEELTDSRRNSKSRCHFLFAEVDSDTGFSSGSEYGIQISKKSSTEDSCTKYEEKQSIHVSSTNIQPSESQTADSSSCTVVKQSELKSLEMSHEAHSEENTLAVSYSSKLQKGIHTSHSVKADKIIHSESDTCQPNDYLEKEKTIPLEADKIHEFKDSLAKDKKNNPKADKICKQAEDYLERAVTPIAIERTPSIEEDLKFIEVKSDLEEQAIDVTFHEEIMKTPTVEFFYGPLPQSVSETLPDTNNELFEEALELLDSGASKAQKSTLETNIASHVTEIADEPESYADPISSFSEADDEMLTDSVSEYFAIPDAANMTLQSSQDKRDATSVDSATIKKLSDVLKSVQTENEKKVVLSSVSTPTDSMSTSEQSLDISIVSGDYENVEMFSDPISSSPEEDELTHSTSEYFAIADTDMSSKSRNEKVEISEKNVIVSSALTNVENNICKTNTLSETIQTFCDPKIPDISDSISDAVLAFTDDDEDKLTESTSEYFAVPDASTLQPELPSKKNSTAINLDNEHSTDASLLTSDQEKDPSELVHKPDFKSTSSNVLDDSTSVLPTSTENNLNQTLKFLGVETSTLAVEGDLVEQKSEENIYTSTEMKECSEKQPSDSSVEGVLDSPGKVLDSPIEAGSSSKQDDESISQVKFFECEQHQIDSENIILSNKTIQGGILDNATTAVVNYEKEGMEFNNAQELDESIYSELPPDHLPPCVPEISNSLIENFQAITEVISQNLHVQEIPFDLTEQSKVAEISSINKEIFSENIDSLQTSDTSLPNESLSVSSTNISLCVESESHYPLLDSSAISTASTSTLEQSNVIEETVSQKHSSPLCDSPSENILNIADPIKMENDPCLTKELEISEIKGLLEDQNVMSFTTNIPSVPSDIVRYLYYDDSITFEDDSSMHEECNNLANDIPLSNAADTSIEVNTFHSLEEDLPNDIKPKACAEVSLENVTPDLGVKEKEPVQIIMKDINPNLPPPELASTNLSSTVQSSVTDVTKNEQFESMHSELESTDQFFDVDVSKSNITSQDEFESIQESEHLTDTKSATKEDSDFPRIPEMIIDKEVNQSHVESDEVTDISTHFTMTDDDSDKFSDIESDSSLNCFEEEAVFPLDQSCNENFVCSINQNMQSAVENQAKENADFKIVPKDIKMGGESEENEMERFEDQKNNQVLVKDFQPVAQDVNGNYNEPKKIQSSDGAALSHQIEISDVTSDKANESCIQTKDVEASEISTPVKDVINETSSQLQGDEFSLVEASKSISDKPQVDVADKSKDLYDNYDPFLVDTPHETGTCPKYKNEKICSQPEAFDKTKEKWEELENIATNKILTHSADKQDNTVEKEEFSLKENYERSIASDVSVSFASLDSSANTFSDSSQTNNSFQISQVEETDHWIDADNESLTETDLEFILPESKAIDKVNLEMKDNLLCPNVAIESECNLKVQDANNVREGVPQVTKKEFEPCVPKENPSVDSEVIIPVDTVSSPSILEEETGVKYVIDNLDNNNITEPFAESTTEVFDVQDQEISISKTIMTTSDVYSQGMSLDIYETKETETDVFPKSVEKVPSDVDRTECSLNFGSTDRVLAVEQEVCSKGTVDSSALIKMNSIPETKSTESEFVSISSAEPLLVSNEDAVSQNIISGQASELFKGVTVGTVYENIQAFDSKLEMDISEIHCKSIEPIESCILSSNDQESEELCDTIEEKTGHQEEMSLNIDTDISEVGESVSKDDLTDISYRSLSDDSDNWFEEESETSVEDVIDDFISNQDDLVTRKSSFEEVTKTISSSELVDTSIKAEFQTIPLYDKKEVCVEEKECIIDNSASKPIESIGDLTVENYSICKEEEITSHSEYIDKQLEKEDEAVQIKSAEVQKIPSFDQKLTSAIAKESQSILTPQEQNIELLVQSESLIDNSELQSIGPTEDLKKIEDNLTCEESEVISHVENVTEQVSLKTDDVFTERSVSDSSEFVTVDSTTQQSKMDSQLHSEAESSNFYSLADNVDDTLNISSDDDFTDVPSHMTITENSDMWSDVESVSMDVDDVEQSLWIEKDKTPTRDNFCDFKFNLDYDGYNMTLEPSIKGPDSAISDTQLIPEISHELVTDISIPCLSSKHEENVPPAELNSISSDYENNNVGSGELLQMNTNTAPVLEIQHASLTDNTPSSLLRAEIGLSTNTLSDYENNNMSSTDGQEFIKMVNLHESQSSQEALDSSKLTETFSDMNEKLISSISINQTDAEKEIEKSTTVDQVPSDPAVLKDNTDIESDNLIDESTSSFNTITDECEQYSDSEATGPFDDYIPSFEDEKVQITEKNLESSVDESKEGDNILATNNIESVSSEAHIMNIPVSKESIQSTSYSICNINEAPSSEKMGVKTSLPEMQLAVSTETTITHDQSELEALKTSESNLAVEMHIKEDISIKGSVNVQSIEAVSHSEVQLNVEKSEISSDSIFETISKDDYSGQLSDLEPESYEDLEKDNDQEKKSEVLKDSIDDTAPEPMLLVDGKKLSLSMADIIESSTLNSESDITGESQLLEHFADIKSLSEQLALVETFPAFDSETAVPKLHDAPEASLSLEQTENSDYWLETETDYSISEFEDEAVSLSDMDKVENKFTGAVETTVSEDKRNVFQTTSQRSTDATDISVSFHTDTDFSDQVSDTCADMSLQGTTTENSDKWSDIEGEVEDGYSKRSLEPDSEYLNTALDIALQLESGSSQLDQVIDSTKKCLNFVQDLDFKIASDVTNIDSKIASGAKDIDSKIASDVIDIDSKIGCDATDIDSKIASDVTDIDSKIASDVIDIDSKIASNVTDIDSKIASDVTVIDSKVLLGSQKPGEAKEIKEQVCSTEEVVPDKKPLPDICPPKQTKSLEKKISSESASIITSGLSDEEFTNVTPFDVTTGDSDKWSDLSDDTSIEEMLDDRKSSSFKTDNISLPPSVLDHSADKIASVKDTNLDVSDAFELKTEMKQSEQSVISDSSIKTDHLPIQTDANENASTDFNIPVKSKNENIVSQISSQDIKVSAEIFDESINLMNIHSSETSNDIFPTSTAVTSVYEVVSELAVESQNLDVDSLDGDGPPFELNQNRTMSAENLNESPYVDDVYETGNVENDMYLEDAEELDPNYEGHDIEYEDEEYPDISEPFIINDDELVYPLQYEDWIEESFDLKEYGIEAVFSESETDVHELFMHAEDDEDIQRAIDFNLNNFEDAMEGAMDEKTLNTDSFKTLSNNPSQSKTSDKEHDSWSTADADSIEDDLSEHDKVLSKIDELLAEDFAYHGDYYKDEDYNDGIKSFESEEFVNTFGSEIEEIEIHDDISHQGTWSEKDEKLLEVIPELMSEGTLLYEDSTESKGLLNASESVSGKLVSDLLRKDEAHKEELKPLIPATEQITETKVIDKQMQNISQTQEMTSEKYKISAAESEIQLKISLETDKLSTVSLSKEIPTSERLLEEISVDQSCSSAAQKDEALASYAQVDGTMESSKTDASNQVTVSTEKKISDISAKSEETTKKVSAKEDKEELKKRSSLQASEGSSKSVDISQSKEIENVSKIDGSKDPKVSDKKSVTETFTTTEETKKDMSSETEIKENMFEARPKKTGLPAKNDSSKVVDESVEETVKINKTGASKQTTVSVDKTISSLSTKSEEIKEPVSLKLEEKEGNEVQLRKRSSQQASEDSKSFDISQNKGTSKTDCFKETTVSSEKTISNFSTKSEEIKETVSSKVEAKEDKEVQPRKRSSRQASEDTFKSFDISQDKETSNKTDGSKETKVSVETSISEISTKTEESMKNTTSEAEIKENKPEVRRKRPSVSAKDDASKLVDESKVEGVVKVDKVDGSKETTVSAEKSITTSCITEESGESTLSVTEIKEGGFEVRRRKRPSLSTNDDSSYESRRRRSKAESDIPSEEQNQSATLRVRKRSEPQVLKSQVESSSHTSVMTVETVKTQSDIPSDQMLEVTLKEQATDLPQIKDLSLKPRPASSEESTKLEAKPDIPEKTKRGSLSKVGKVSNSEDVTTDVPSLPPKKSKRKSSSGSTSSFSSLSSSSESLSSYESLSTKEAAATSESIPDVPARKAKLTPSFSSNRKDSSDDSASSSISRSSRLSSGSLPKDSETLARKRASIDEQMIKLQNEGKCTTKEKAFIAAKLIEMQFEEQDALLASRQCSSVYHAVKFLTQLCELCNCRFPINLMSSMVYCTHRACKECLKAHFTTLIYDRSIFTLLCPICQKPDITDQNIQEYFNNLDMMFRNILDSSVYDLFQRKLRDEVLTKDPNFHWCSQCSSGFIASPRLKKLYCPDCSAITCSSCHQTWELEHEGVHCERFQQWKDMHTPEPPPAGSVKFLVDRGITCPSCGIEYAQASGGCLMYKCSHCSFEFCGFCIKPYKRGKDCGNKSCDSLGIHAHHSFSCLFFLRDKDVQELQLLLEEESVTYLTIPPKDQIVKSRCQVREQKHIHGNISEDRCGRDIVPYCAGLCRTHYFEYLAELLRKNKINPLPVMTTQDLQFMFRKCRIAVPEKVKGETNEEYYNRLTKIVSRTLT